MLPSSAKGDVVLRLLEGRSEQRELVLDGGRPRTPFALGSRGGWRIEAGHVAAAHVMVAFNGRSLYVCVSRDEMAVLDGVPLDAQWREASMPSELRFGSARMSIGRRAGPEEETQDPEPEATRMANACLPKRTPALQLRSPREEEDTCFDEDRLRAALALSRQDEEITRLADVDAPAVVAPASLASAPTPPFRRPAIRTIRMPTASRVSSMPPTAPSEAPFRVAPSRPSSPTMAVALPSDAAMSTGSIGASRAHAASGHQAFDSIESLESGVLAVSGETSSATSTHPPPVPSSVPRAGLGALAHGWRQASVAKRAILVLMVPALLAALLATSRPSRVPAESAESTGSGAPAATATTDSTPRAVAQPAATAAPIASASASATPIVSAPRNAPSKAAAGLRDTRTAERRALDTVASGLDAAAIEQYEVLAREDPGNVAFREAARILRQRAALATQVE